MNNKLSENLKKIRKDNNLSQEQLAEMLNVSRQSISKWESSQAYPEMDKLMLICEKFNLNINDLLHNDIREVKENEETNKKLNNYIESVLNFITDSINIFSKMTFKSKIKMIFEQLLILLVLYIIFMTIGDVFSSVISRLFYNVLPNGLFKLVDNTLQSIYIIFSCIFIIAAMINTFKNRYLDYYKKELKNEDKEEQQEETKENKISKKEDRIIIRDNTKDDYKFINVLFKIILFIIKINVFFISLGFCASLVGLFIAFGLSFLVAKSGLFFIGIILTIISSAIINVDVLLVLYNFVFGRKINIKIIILTFISSLIAAGLGIGLIITATVNFDYSDTNKYYVQEQQEIDMLENSYFIRNVEYIEEDRSNLRIEYNKYQNSTVEIANHGDVIVLLSTNNNQVETFKQMLKDINKKEIHNMYSDVDNIKVYTSSENIEKLKNNIEK